MIPAGYVIFADICTFLNLPTKETIVAQCRTDFNVRGKRLDPNIPDATPVWVKYGRSVTMGEAHTQDMVWKTFDANPDPRVRVARVYQAFQDGRVGYIVMECIDVVACEKSDMKQVAAAVECLIELRSPTQTLGPVGGGSIKHHFFVDWDSSVTYRTVGQLEDHINNVLKYQGLPNRVNFKDEVSSEGLRLSPCDITSGNFMKDGLGDIIALDFGDVCFLPSSFFDFAMVTMLGTFGLRVAKHLKYEQSSNINAMILASSFLVITQTNKFALPKELK